MKRSKARYFNQQLDVSDAVTEVDPYRALVRSIMVRAYRDAFGHFDNQSHHSDEVVDMDVQDAVDFFSDGRWFRFCDYLGIDDPAGLLAEIERIERRIGKE